jgi:hypothetical protein
VIIKVACQQFTRTLGRLATSGISAWRLITHSSTGHGSDCRKAGLLVALRLHYCSAKARRQDFTRLDTTQQLGNTFAAGEFIPQVVLYPSSLRDVRKSLTIGMSFDLGSFMRRLHLPRRWNTLVQQPGIFCQPDRHRGSGRPWTLSRFSPAA